MTLEQELRLSYYREVAEINADHGIHLVQDVRSKKFFVRKRLTVYNPEVYQYLWANPIANTPKIYLAEEDGEVLAVIEEYIPGDTLEEILAQRGALPEEEVLEITSQLCRILSAFHSCSPAIVNRDIKPSNLKITPDGVVKLVDLNAAKWSNELAEKDTVLLGTQGYAAPEQYGFGPSSVLTDIYSVGVLMNVMRTGLLPNQGIASGKLGKVIRKCTELSPKGRYQSVEALAAALDALSEKPREEKKPGSWQRYLLPGFRSRNVIRWLGAALGYVMLLYFSLTLQVENAGHTELLLNRLFLGLAAFGVVLFSGNYLDVQSKFFMTRSKHKWVRVGGILLIDVAILFLAVFSLVLIQDVILA